MAASSSSQPHVINPGPEDDSLLGMQEIHVSQHVWNDETDRVLKVRRAT